MRKFVSLLLIFVMVASSLTFAADPRFSSHGIGNVRSNQNPNNPRADVRLNAIEKEISAINAGLIEPGPIELLPVDEDTIERWDAISMTVPSVNRENQTVTSVPEDIPTVMDYLRRKEQLLADETLVLDLETVYLGQPDAPSTTLSKKDGEDSQNLDNETPINRVERVTFGMPGASKTVLSAPALFQSLVFGTDGQKEQVANYYTRQPNPLVPEDYREEYMGIMTDIYGPPVDGETRMLTADLNITDKGNLSVFGNPVSDSIDDVFLYNPLNLGYPRKVLDWYQDDIGMPDEEVSKYPIYASVYETNKMTARDPLKEVTPKWGDIDYVMTRTFGVGFGGLSLTNSNFPEDTTGNLTDEDRQFFNPSTRYVADYHQNDLLKEVFSASDMPWAENAPTDYLTIEDYVNSIIVGLLRSQHGRFESYQDEITPDTTPIEEGDMETTYIPGKTFDDYITNFDDYARIWALIDQYSYYMAMGRKPDRSRGDMPPFAQKYENWKLDKYITVDAPFLTHTRPSNMDKVLAAPLPDEPRPVPFENLPVGHQYVYSNYVKALANYENRFVEWFKDEWANKMGTPEFDIQTFINAVDVFEYPTAHTMGQARMYPIIRGSQRYMTVDISPLAPDFSFPDFSITKMKVVNRLDDGTWDVTNPSDVIDPGRDVGVSLEFKLDTTKMTKSTVERTVELLEGLIGDPDKHFPVSLMNTNLDVYTVTPNDVFYNYNLPDSLIKKLVDKLKVQADMEDRMPIYTSVIFDIPYVDKNTISIVDDKHKLTAMVNTTAVLDGYNPTYIGTTRLGTYVPELILANNVMNAEFTVIDPSTNIWVENVVPMQVVGDPSNPADRVEADYSDGSSGFGISMDIFASEPFDTSKGVDICISTSFGDRFDLSAAEVEMLSRDGGLRVFWYLGVLDPTDDSIWTNNRIDFDITVNCSQEATAVILPTYVDETGGGAVSQYDAYRDNKATVSIFRAVAGTDNVYINYDDLSAD